MKNTKGRAAKARWWFRLSAAVLGPVLLLGAAELGLRLGGYGYETSFFKPLRIQGKDYLVENDKFGWRYFPSELARSPAPLRMQAHKPPGRCRIFLLGESAALGDPRPAYGAGRYLQVLLEERFPGRQFEVVCVAMTAINSHAVLDIARECAQHEGDFWIIYLGNNEMVGPFGAATVFGPQAPGRWLVRLSLVLQETRVGQLLRSWGRKLRHRPPRSWAGMEMFTESRVAPGDPRRARVYRNFRANLAGILQAGLASGAQVMLSTVAVNLRDSAPFASMPRAQLSPEEQKECERLLNAAVSAEAATNFSAAAQSLAQAASIDPQRADLQFYLAGCLLTQTNLAAARQHFQRACDLDALPFRADSTINAALVDASREYAGPKLSFSDAAADLAAATPIGIPGAESFYEHVHFNFDGNYRLAQAWAEQIGAVLERGAAGQNGLSGPTDTSTSPALLTASAPANPLRIWATQEVCERRLGLTDWNRAGVLEDMLRRLAQPPLSTQVNNGRRFEALRQQWLELRRRCNETNASAARQLYLEALQRAPDDERLHENYGEFLEDVGELAQAQDQWDRVRELIPQHHLGYFETGRLLLRIGNLPEARRRLLQAVALRPDLSEGWLELGNIHAMEGKTDLALPEYERAKDLVPQDPRVYYHLGKVYSNLHRQADALEQLRQAIKLQPGYWEAHYALGEELGFSGQLQEARTEFETVLRLNPDYAMAHLNLGVALAQQGNFAEATRQLQEAQRLDPKNPLAEQYLKKLEALKGKGK